MITPMRERTMDAVRASRSTILILLQNAVQFGVGLLFFAIATKFLTKTEIGLISTFSFISILFVSLAPLSLQVAATKYMAELLGQNKKEKASSVAKTIRKWVFRVSFVLLLLGNVIPTFFLVRYQEQTGPIIWVLIYGFFWAIRITYQAFLQGLQMFERYALIGILSLISSRGIGVLLMILNYGLIGVVVGWTIGEAIGFLISTFFYRNILPETKTYYNYKPLLSFSLPILFMTVITAVSDWTDRMLLLTLTSDLEKLGIYDLVIRGSSTLALIWMAMSVTLLPILSESYGHSGKREISNLNKVSMKYIMYFIAPASLGLAAISKSAIALLFGWEYTVGNVSLMILALFSIVLSLSTIASTTLQAIGKTKVFFKITLIKIITNLMVSILLIPSFGVNGAASARAVMIIIGFIYTFYELRKEIRLEFDKLSMLKTLIAALVMAAPLIIFDNFYSEIVITNAALSVAIEITLGIVVYGIIMLLTKALSKQDLELLRGLSPKSLSKIINRVESFFY